jgi:carbon-monoxide dehydrogenase large subunit
LDRVLMGVLVGKPVKRIEDSKLITGSGCYVADIKLPRMLYIHFIRSPHPHAIIKDVRIPDPLPKGVVTVYKGRDLQHIGPLPVDYVEEGSKTPRQYPLAVDRVRYVGEAVAAVVAEDEYVARDAAELVSVEYQPLPAVVDPLKAIEPDSSLVHEELGSNICLRWRRSYGDVAGAFASSYKTVALKLRIQRLAPTPMETRGIVANYDKSTGLLTVWSSTQSPHSLREALSEVLNHPENLIRVIAPDVGGGFGAKYNCYPEDVAACYISMKLGRPVKWIEDRIENLHTMSHGRDMYAEVEAAVQKDGKVEGLRAKIVADFGAYNCGYTQSIPIMTAKMITGCYKIRNLEVEVLGVITNKMATNAYRGAGRPEASYIIERTMDRIARHLGLDPVHVRKVNFIQSTEFPYKTVTGFEYDTGDYVKALDRALELVDYWELRREQQRLRSMGRLLGVGISSYVEVCNFAYQSAQVRVDAGGKVYVLTGTSPHGQGVATALAQIVSDALGFMLEDILVLHGDTQLIPRGPGTAGSWSLTSGGNAVLLACMDVGDKMRRIAASLLEANPDDIVLSGGRAYVRDSPEQGISLKEVAAAAYDVNKLPDGTEPGLVSTRFYTPKLTFPFGTHVAVVEVDGETGQVSLKRIVMVNDCGRLVNPLLAEGQVHGGAAQAIGQALYEEFLYDGDGIPLTSTLFDYFIPTSADVPRMETYWTVTMAPNPLGSKGIGEAATIGLTPAIVNAVEDALSHLGVEISETPLTPGRILSTIHAIRL